MKIKNINKFIYPIVIIVSAMIIGGSFMWVQYNKQESIEKQQRLELEAERKKAEIGRIEAEVKTKQEKEDKVFSNNLKCQTLLKDLKQRWNNVVGIYYSEWQNTCIVKYTEDGETEEASIESMQDKE